MYQICKTATAAKKMQNDCHPHLENSETLAKFPDSEILGQCNTLGAWRPIRWQKLLTHRTDKLKHVIFYTSLRLVDCWKS